MGDFKKIFDQVNHTLEEYHYPVFANDMTEDEIRLHKSFLIYDEDGEITKTRSPLNYSKSFYIDFVTRENKTIPEIDLIEAVKELGFVFDRTEKVKFRLQKTDEIYKATRFIFHYILQVCY